jgi:acetyl esterase/lipase
MREPIAALARRHCMIVPIALAFSLSLAATVTSTTLPYGPDTAQQVDVYVDSTASARNKPIAIFFHGGVWQHGDRKDDVELGQALAQRGFVAVIASYRLTPHARWPAQGEDAAAVVDLALTHAAQWGGDSTNVVVMGHSAGAQMAAVLVLDPHFLAAHKRSPTDIHALALLSGVFDLQAPLDASQDDGGFAAFVQPTFGAKPDVLRAASPLVLLHAWHHPVLLVTSEHDYSAMRAQTFAMQRKLTSLGVQPAFVDVPHVDHFGIVAHMHVAGDPTMDAVVHLAGL